MARCRTSVASAAAIDLLDKRVGIAALALLMLVLPACNDNDDGSAPAAAIDCSAAAAYAPAVEPRVLGDLAAATRVIVMHGKTGGPYTPHLESLLTDLSEAGYEVVAPYLPWAGSVWTGTMCEGLAYVRELADEATADGKRAMVVGHSMGGMHALIHAVDAGATPADALVVIAPGHFLHESTRMKNLTAADVTRARTMVANGEGDELATFVTLNGGNEIQLSATARAYLSFHDPDQFPALATVLPHIAVPVLWVAGSDDPLTATYDMAARAAQIKSAGSEYHLIAGTHTGVVENASEQVRSWMEGVE